MQNINVRKLLPILVLLLIGVVGLFPAASSLVHAQAGISRDINTYVLFAYHELVFKGGNTATGSGYIMGGNIGVNYSGYDSNRDLAYGTSSRAIMSDGYQAVANVVLGGYRVANPTRLWDLYANETKPDPFPVPIDGSGPLKFSDAAGNAWDAPGAGADGWIIATADLPTLPFTPGRYDPTSGSLGSVTTDLQVLGAGGEPSPYTLAPGDLRDVRLNNNAVLNLTDGIYNMRDLSVGRDVTINVTDGTELWIDSTFNPNNNLKFGMNPEHNGGAHVYVGGGKYLANESYAGLFNINTEQVTNFAHNGADRSEQIHMQYFAPNSWLDLGGGNELYGRFWAGRITGDPNNNVYYVAPPPTAITLSALQAAGSSALSLQSALLLGAGLAIGSLAVVARAIRKQRVR